VALLLVSALGGLQAGSASAAGWGGIEPGATREPEVRERYGAPSRQTRQTMEGHETAAWVYEGPRAPVGLVRMTVEFGLVRGSAYDPALVRALRLEPKRGIFDRDTVIAGWGVPTGIKRDGGPPEYFYAEGLVVVFDAEGLEATHMLFTPPQPAAGAGPAPEPAGRPAAPGR
jgi:hypothetical protein